MTEEPIEVRTSSGDALRGLISHPHKGGPMVVLCHGINSDLHEDFSPGRPGVFDLLVRELDKNGWGTVRFDFRGHGTSDGKQEDVSPLAQAEDLRQMLAHLGAVGYSRVVIVAASFGSVASALVSERDRLETPMVFINPVVSLRRTFAEPETDWAKRSFHDKAFASLSTSGYLLLDDEFRIGSAFVAEARSVDSEAAFESIAVPSLFIHGTDDTYVSYQISRETAFKVDKSSFISVPGAEHGFGDLNTRTSVVAMTVDWLNLVTTRGF